jgi:hypothetical protein
VPQELQGPDGNDGRLEFVDVNDPYKGLLASLFPSSKPTQAIIDELKPKPEDGLDEAMRQIVRGEP